MLPKDGGTVRDLKEEHQSVRRRRTGIPVDRVVWHCVLSYGRFDYKGNLIATLIRKGISSQSILQRTFMDFLMDSIKNSLGDLLIYSLWIPLRIRLRLSLRIPDGFP